ncbi:MAG: threonylcarbamoyl-AMP synthase [Candidatus Izimaplasma sp.]|nr:threonylcarbamoyl-AMP synthase [Candidatus Izimaplasma bacterium]
MKTTVYHLSETTIEELLNQATQVISQGGLVVFPTETVYGIGANALDKNAAKKIYEVKGRPSDNPLIVHIANKKDVFTYTTVTPGKINLLIDTFWPGPLTLVLYKKSVIPDEITGGLKTVAIRFPDNEIAKGLIQQSNLPICAPSANISGRPSSTTFKHVYEDLDGKVDLIIDGGPSKVGLESTVLDLTTDIPTILRPGAITKTMLESVLKTQVIDDTVNRLNKEIPKAPGMKYKHYAPKGKVTLLKGSNQAILRYLRSEVMSSNKTGVIASSELTNKLELEHVFDLGSINQPETIAKNIFLALRTMDELNIETIYIEAFDSKELNAAIMNRLLKAANHHIIYLD